jgi:predicted Zn finger-like uncharacterized protein
MAIVMKTRCPSCRAQLKVRDELIGRTGRCPKCREEFRLEPESPAIEQPPSIDFDVGADDRPDENVATAGAASEADEYGDIEAPHLLAATRPVKKKNSEATADEDAEDGPADGKPKRRLRSRRTTLGMLASLVAAPFWRSALRRFPYLAAALAFVGGLLGFLVGLIHSALVADLVLNLIGIPMAFAVFFLMCYPTACFWKVVVGSSEGSGDIAEWPEGNFGEWVFEMLIVGYMVLISLLLSAGVAKLWQTVARSDQSSGNSWQLMENDEMAEAAALPQKLLKKFVQNPEPAEAEPAPPHRLLRPGPAWLTTFLAFMMIFPFVVVSCLESSTPLFVPWSTRVWLSLLKNATAWLVAVIISAAVLSSAVALAILGATFAPFLIFTLCSPLAAVGLLIYGRLLGRLSWLIART